MVKPPNIKNIVATNDGHCKLAKPIMECPEVQPLAYRVPKPTKKPPITKKKRPLSVKRLSNEKISKGMRWLKSLIPKTRKSSMVL